jgi:hypothetical protein
MRLPTQILLLGAILTSSARALETPPAASPAAATQTAPAYAPDAPVQLEPVIVTADLWQTPLEKITASVSVYDGTRFASDGVTPSVRPTLTTKALRASATSERALGTPPAHRKRRRAGALRAPD